MSKNNKQNNTQKINLFPALEKEVLDFWDKADTFKKSLEKDSPNGGYTFYDGPPFATGTPHYGHIVASVMKDAVPRYWTMKGYHVDRKWGWDCHGLPVENLAEKELELKDKHDIEKIGVEKFNSYCESIVMRYATEWKEIIKRIGRWVDMENDYKTMDPDYMESIWWVFKSLWDKGLIYRGYKAMHICPRCGTTLSNFEVTLGYKDIKDISATVKFELEDEPDTYVLAWTTTPWTLIGNVALAVGKDIDYVLAEETNLVTEINSPMKHGEYEIKQNCEKFIIAKETIVKEDQKLVPGDNLSQVYVYNGKNYRIINTVKGKDLIGKKYKPLFDYYQNKDLENKENGWKIYAADFVTTEEGTGIVHIAPAFGEDDLDLGQKENLPFIQHVDGTGRFTEDVKDWLGVEVKQKDNHQATDIEIIKYLAGKNLLFAKEKYEHSYPHCWRCDTPLLNYAADSWFVAVTKIKDKLINSNKDVNWVPEHIKEGRFGKWLEQARDWAISRNRYWGTPLPVWVCDKCGETAVIGSKEELEKHNGGDISNLHKQYVDKIEWLCSKCDGKMVRIPEVLDCWFESGSMPYAQNHYLGKPLENFDPEKGLNFPAEFIAEGVDQTRGWFYTLMVLATALFDKSSYKHVIVNGIVLAEDGQKMSKRLRNYPDPAELFEEYSVDAMRYYLLASPVLMAENLNFSAAGVNEVLRKIEMILWNVYKFYEMYADTVISTSPRAEEKSLKRDIKTDKGFLPNGRNDNVLDKWILARLNQLIGEVTENMDKYLMPKAVRPFMEFIDDLSTWYIRRSRDRFKSSYAKASADKGDDKKDKEDALLTTRYVLIELSKAMAPFMPFIAEQVWQKVSGYNFEDENKSVHLEEWPSFAEVMEGESILDNMEMARKIVELGLAKRDEAGIKIRQPLNELKVKSEKLKVDNEYLELIKDEVNVKTVNFSNDEEHLVVELDIKLTPELKLEGTKREVVRSINALRKEVGMTINDRAIIYWETKSEILQEVFEKMSDEVLKDTLSSDIEKGVNDQVDARKELKINGEDIILCVKKQ